MPERVPILFVDDEAAMRQAVTQWLELAGFQMI
jgi:DNA-binding NtrC family response regulator